MKRLRVEPFERPNRRQLASGERGHIGRLLFIAMFAAISLLVLSRLDHPFIHVVKGRASELLSPVLEVASVPAAALARLRGQVATYMDLFVEIDRLKLENQQLKQYVWRAQVLEAETAQYRKLLKGVQEPGLDFVTARVIADSRGVFVRSILINAGADNGVRNGQAVINGEGMIGRIVDGGPGVARVLLVTDLNSHIPVIVGAGSERAVLHGDNTALPALEHLATETNIAPGDIVFTSGQDGILPKGLKIGTVKASGDVLVVETQVGSDNLEYVSVLLYAGPKMDLMQGPGAGLDRKATGAGKDLKRAAAD